MFKFISRVLLSGNDYVSAPAILANSQANPRLQLPLLCISTRCFSEKSKEESLVVPYLINTCGLSPQSALSVSKRVSFKTTEKPDSVIRFLKLQGFSASQISKTIRKWPRLLLSKPQKTLLPKFKLLLSKGFSSDDLTRTMSTFPFILRRNLEKTIVPVVECFEDFIKSEKEYVKAVERAIYAFDDDAIYLKSNIGVLKDHGVPDSSISLMLRSWPGALFLKTKKFGEIVDEVKEMGFDPTKVAFVIAVYAKRYNTKLSWARKVDIFRKRGWSDKMILDAFRWHPWIMTTSKEKIITVMDFFVSKMGWSTSVIAKKPLLLSLSLQKRLIPRAAVIQYLLSRGLVEDSNWLMFAYPEKTFLEKFVNCYDEAPQLLELYYRKMNNGC